MFVCPEPRAIIFLPIQLSVLEILIQMIQSSTEITKSASFLYRNMILHGVL